MRAMLGAAAGLLLWSASVAAQDRHTFDPALLTPGDTVWVTTGDVIQKGTVIRTDANGLTLTTSSGERTFAIASILRIRHRQNGWKMGALVGAAAAVPAIIYARQREKGDDPSSGAPPIVVVGMGAGAGALIDGIFGRRRIVYERRDVAGRPDGLSEGVRLFAAAGSAVRQRRYSTITTDHLSAGLLFRLGQGPLSIGAQVERLGGGPIVAYDFGSRARRIRPYVNGGYLLPYPGLWQAGGGADFSIHTNASLRAGVRNVFVISRQDQLKAGLARQWSLELGVVLR